MHFISPWHNPSRLVGRKKSKYRSVPHLFCACCSGREREREERRKEEKKEFQRQHSWPNRMHKFLWNWLICDVKESLLRLQPSLFPFWFTGIFVRTWWHFDLPWRLYSLCSSRYWLQYSWFSLMACIKNGSEHLVCACEVVWCLKPLLNILFVIFVTFTLEAVGTRCWLLMLWLTVTQI